MLQLEVPVATSIAAAKRARDAGALVVLDPAPAASLPVDTYPLFDCLTPNEIEAAAMVGFTVDGPDAALAAARTLVGQGARAAMVTIGAQGVCYATPTDADWLPAYVVDAVDSVAAGDAFAGALTVALAEGLGLRDAVRWGMAAGALCATRRGAQVAMPTRDEVMALLAR